MSGEGICTHPCTFFFFFFTLDPTGSCLFLQSTSSGTKITNWIAPFMGKMMHMFQFAYLSVVKCNMGISGETHTPLERVETNKCKCNWGNSKASILYFYKRPFTDIYHSQDCNGWASIPSFIFTITSLFLGLLLTFYCRCTSYLVCPAKKQSMVSVTENTVHFDGCIKLSSNPADIHLLQKMANPCSPLHCYNCTCTTSSTL